MGSWFTLEKAKELVNYSNGEMIYEYDYNGEQLWEVFATGGDVNITGAIGGSSVQQSSGTVGNSGGSGFFGGGVGPGGDGQASPTPSANSGSGGSSAGTSSSAVPGGGGSAGGYVRKIISAPSATYSYAVGAGGAAGTSSIGAGSSAGAAGIIIVTEFYV
jgi:hypothetical protein